MGLRPEYGKHHGADQRGAMPGGRRCWTAQGIPGANGNIWSTCEEWEEAKKVNARLIELGETPAGGKYVCSVCGYVYDPAEHDGVAFEDLPEDWVCPRCKQPKEKFNRA